MKTEPALCPCPFCGARAELDTAQQYRNITTGALELAVSVYCTGCSVNLTVCRVDVPNIEPSQLVAAWNQRAAA